MITRRSILKLLGLTPAAPAFAAQAAIRDYRDHGLRADIDRYMVLAPSYPQCTVIKTLATKVTVEVTVNDDGEFRAHVDHVKKEAVGGALHRNGSGA